MAVAAGETVKRLGILIAQIRAIPISFLRPTAFRGRTQLFCARHIGGGRLP
jgi:hypothetical protein